MQAISGQSNGDLLSVQLVDSALVVRYDPGGGAAQVTVGEGLADGALHVLEIGTFNQQVEVAVDNRMCQRGSCYGVAQSRGSLTSLNTQGILLIGGLNYSTSQSSRHLVTPITTFIGVVGDLAVNNIPTDLNPFSSLGYRNVDIGSQREMVCAPNPCQNNGICMDLWFTYSCQCSSGFMGSNCTDQNLANFANDSFLQIPSTSGQLLSEIIFSFTTLWSDGILAYSANVSTFY